MESDTWQKYSYLNWYEKLEKDYRVSYHISDLPPSVMNVKALCFHIVKQGKSPGMTKIIGLEDVK
jgi:hypothetical protein